MVMFMKLGLGTLHLRSIVIRWRNLSMFPVSPILFLGVPIGGISSDVLFYTAREFTTAQSAARGM